MGSKPTRGELNNNPGNIRHSTTVWMGQDTDQPDPAFVKFTGAGWGIRAMVRTLMSYQVRDGVRTMREAINRWAPPSENDTGSYVNDVCERCSVDPDTAVLFPAVMPSLVKAIIHHENGRCVYDDQTIAQAIEMAKDPS